VETSSEGFDLVAVLYLQLPQPERSIALEVAASAVAPGGTFWLWLTTRRT